MIIVLSLMGFFFTVAMPSMMGPSASEISGRLGRLLGDVRAAYDMSVLTNKHYRLVFHLASGDYWLETTDSSTVKIGNANVDLDPTVEEQKEAIENFNTDFAEYKDLAGETVTDPESEQEIVPESPVLQAEEKLKVPEWYPVQNLEWKKRSLGPELIIKSMQSEHHQRRISIEEDGEQVAAFIYFFPNGYVQKAYIHIYYREGDLGYDEEQEPYTIRTHAWEGVASILDGYVEVDLTKDEEEAI